MIPKSDFSLPSLYELGAAKTFFEFKTNAKLDFFRFKRLVSAHILSVFAQNGIVFEHPRLPGPVQKPIPAIGSVVPWHAYPKTLYDSSPAMTLSFDVSESSR